MKGLIQTLFMILVMVGVLYAGAELVKVGQTTEVAGPYAYYYQDSIVLHVKNGIKVLTFDKPIWNLKLFAINAPTDSGYCKVWSQHWQTILDSHNDTLSYTWYPVTFGENSVDDSIYFYCRTQKIWLSPVKGGTADSVITIKIEGAGN